MAATLNLIAIPVIAGLAAGGGALANYAGGSTAAPATIAEPAIVSTAVPSSAMTPAMTPAITKPADRPCDAQTWPYLDAKCLTQASRRPVRMVMAPRTEESEAAGDGALPTGPRSAAVAAPDRIETPPGLTTGTAVLYTPRTVAPTGKPQSKRSHRSTRRSARLYRVPSESRSGSGAFVVVRPLRLGAFR